MEPAWHNVVVEVISPDETASKFDSLRIESRRKDDEGKQTISLLGERNYYPESKGLYSFTYILKNPSVSLWLTLVADGREKAERITAGVHRYEFSLGRRAGKRHFDGDPDSGPRVNQTTFHIQSAYFVGAENFFANVESFEMAKYKIEGSRNILTGEKASLTGSANMDSRVTLAPEVEQALSKASAVAKGAKSEEARKAVSSLKREAKKNAPDKSKMRSMWDGAVKAAPSIIKEVGPSAVEAIKGLFS